MDEKRGRGRPTARIAVEGPWEDAVGKALKKPRPAEGWPVKPVRKAKKKSSAKRRKRRG